MFVEEGAPTGGELHALLHTLITQLMKLLKRLGALTEEMDQTYLAESDAAGDQARVLQRLRAAVVTPSHRLRPPALTIRHRRSKARCRAAAPRHALCADIDGFTQHSKVRCEAHVRKRLEQLCRYVTGPTLSD